METQTIVATVIVLLGAALVTGLGYYARKELGLKQWQTAVDYAELVVNSIDDTLASALLAGYQAVRPLSTSEADAWPVMLRAGALRFWVSRLLDFHQPASGELTFTKDPGVFQQLLAAHRQRTRFWL